MLIISEINNKQIICSYKTSFVLIFNTLKLTFWNLELQTFEKRD